MPSYHPSHGINPVRRLGIVTLLLGLTACPDRAPTLDSPLAWDHTPVSIQGRLAEDEPAEGLTEAPVVGDEEVVHLHPEVRFSSADLRYVEVVPDGEPLTLHLWFTEAGAARVAAVTEANVGRRFALLVNGNVVSAPLIARPLRPDPELPVTVEVQLPEAEAEGLAGAIARTWPPEAEP